MANGAGCNWPFPDPSPGDYDKAPAEKGISGLANERSLAGSICVRHFRSFFVIYISSSEVSLTKHIQPLLIAEY